MIRAEVTGVEEVNEMLNDLPEYLFEVAKKEIQRATLSAQKKTVQPLSKGVNGLQSRSGNLARSIQTEIKGSNLGTLRGYLFTKSPYAPVHEYGAEGNNAIKAKNAYTSLPGGPFLNIPSSNNKTGAGITRLTARDVFSQGGYIIKINAPKAQYAVMLGDKAMFWLVKSVEIKARLNMNKTAVDEVPTLLSNLDKDLLIGKYNG